MTVWDFNGQFVLVLYISSTAPSLHESMGECNEYQRKLCINIKQAHCAMHQPISMVLQCKLVSGWGLLGNGDQHCPMGHVAQEWLYIFVHCIFMLLWLFLSSFVVHYFWHFGWATFFKVTVCTGTPDLAIYNRVCWLNKNFNVCACSLFESFYWFLL